MRNFANEKSHYFHPHCYVSLWSYGLVDVSFPQRSLRPSQGSRQVPHVATDGPEALVEHDGGFVVFGHALAHSVRDHGCRTPNRIILLRDNTLNFPVMAQQPHPDPNYATHTVVSIPGARSSMQPLVLLAVRHFNSRSS